ncbi:MAG: helix-turn-helix domain-containing protein [Rivularia sp. (in: cyanobacteria)]
MTKNVIRWKLSEIMARHRVKGKDLANYLGISANSVSALKRAEVMP